MKFSKNKLNILLFVFTFVIIVINNLFLTISHEQVHVIISRSFNCENIEVDYGYFIKNAKTTSICDLNYSENLEFNKLNIFNEIITYNVKNISYILIFFLFVISFIIINKDK